MCRQGNSSPEESGKPEKGMGRTAGEVDALRESIVLPRRIPLVTSESVSTSEDSSMVTRSNKGLPSKKSILKGEGVGYILILLLIGVLNPCHAQDSIGAALHRIYQNYLSMAQSPDISRLVSLDHDLRQMFDCSWDILKRVTDSGAFHEEYRAIGISIGHYSDVIGYSGKLLLEAHKLDPVSSFRSYTLYSFANCDAEDCSMPNIDSARLYVKQFPNGPYIYEVYSTLGRFYDDLYKEIKRVKDNEGYDYKYDCYGPYVTAEPLKNQLARAQKRGIYYYRKAIQRHPKDAVMRGNLIDLQNGTTNGWYFCSD